MRICIEGNIGSGKSECMAAVEAAFPGVPCFPEPVEEWGELLHLFYQNPAEWAFPFNLKVLLSFHTPAAHETCVVERCPLSSRHVFGQVSYNEGVMNCQEWELFKEYHSLLGWEPDVIFYIHTPPEECLRRINERNRVCEKNIDIAYLEKLDFQYANMLRFAHVPVVRFDGTQSRAELHEALITAVKDRLSLPTPSSGEREC